MGIYKKLPLQKIDETIEGNAIENIVDVNFGRCKSIRGMTKKAFENHYIKIYVKSDSGKNIQVFKKLKV